MCLVYGQIENFNNLEKLYLIDVDLNEEINFDKLKKLKIANFNSSRIKDKTEFLKQFENRNIKLSFGEKNNKVMEEIKFDNEYLNRLFREKFKKQSFTLEDIKSAEIILIDFSFAKDKKISQKDLDILTKNSFIILENINCSNLTFNLMRGAKIYLKSCNLNGCILQESNDDKEYDVNYYADFLGISNNVFSDFLNIEKSSKKNII